MDRNMRPAMPLSFISRSIRTRTYDAGSWQDKLIEAFGDTHDMIGGKLSGLYDEQGNIKRGMSGAEAALYDRWSEAAIPIALPCGAAHPA